MKKINKKQLALGIVMILQFPALLSIPAWVQGLDGLVISGVIIFALAWPSVFAVIFGMFLIDTSIKRQ